MTENQEKQPKINLAVKAAEDDLLGTGRTILAEAGRWPCLALPDMETEADCKCRNMYSFISRLETMADEKTVRRILYRVRHGLRRSLTVSLRAEWYDLC